MIPELRSEPVGDLDDVIASGQVPDEADVVLARRLIIAHEQAKERLADVKKTKAAVTAAYDLRAGAIQAQIEQIRSWLSVYVERHGKLSLPDVGSVHFQTRTTKPKIADVEAALAYALEHARAMIVEQPALDVDAYLGMAQTVVEVTGEILPGFDPGGEESRSLVVKA